MQPFEAAVARLETGEPVQYVLGETDFMGLTIRCDARALIPRPETEGLVGCAEDFLREQPGNPVVVDVCTGSGCIACALARRVPAARLIATDLSPAALELATANAHALQVAVDFRQTDLLEGIPDDSVDLVVSNPPVCRNRRMRAPAAGRCGTSSPEWPWTGGRTACASFRGLSPRPPVCLHREDG